MLQLIVTCKFMNSRTTYWVLEFRNNLLLSHLLLKWTMLYAIMRCQSGQPIFSIHKGIVETGGKKMSSVICISFQGSISKG